MANNQKIRPTKEQRKARRREEFTTVRRQAKEHPKLTATYFVLRLLVLAVMVLEALKGNYYNVFLCGLTLVLFLIPTFVEHRLHIDVPNTLEVIILLFIFSAEILGEIQEYYLIFPFWDTMLHTMNGFLMAAIGVAMVDILNRSDKFKVRLSPAFVALVAFCFSMTTGVVWEFFEYAMDCFIGMDMQKDTVVHAIHSVTLDPTRTNQVVTISGITDTAVNGESLGLGGYLDIGIIDTMKDLFVNFLGALVFSVSGYFYARSRGKKKSPALNFVPTRKTPEQDYLQQAQEEEQP